MKEWLQKDGSCGLGRITGFGLAVASITCDPGIFVLAVASDVLTAIVLKALG